MLASLIPNLLTADVTYCFSPPPYNPSREPIFPTALPLWLEQLDRVVTEQTELRVNQGALREHVQPVRQTPIHNFSQPARTIHQVSSRFCVCRRLPFHPASLTWTSLCRRATRELLFPRPQKTPSFWWSTPSFSFRGKGSREACCFSSPCTPEQNHPLGHLDVGWGMWDSHRTSRALLYCLPPVITGTFALFIFTVIVRISFCYLQALLSSRLFLCSPFF